MAYRSQPRALAPALGRVQMPMKDNVHSEDHSTSSSTHSLNDLNDLNHPKISVGLSKNWIIPPRPKPGRKPTIKDADDKRTQQNRNSQRSFRDRTNQKIQNLESIIADLQAKTADNEIKYMYNIAQLEEEVKTLKKRNKELENALYYSRPMTSNTTKDHSGDDTKATVSSHGVLNTVRRTIMPEVNIIGVSMPLPRSLVNKRANDESSPLNDLANAALNTHEEGNNSIDMIGDGCGFCTAETICVCRSVGADLEDKSEEESTTKTPNPSGEYIGLPPINNLNNNESANQKHPTLEPSRLLHMRETKIVSNQEPGTCPSCQKDPDRKRFCTSLAKEVNSRTTSANPEPEGASEFIPCSQVYQVLNEHKGFDLTDRARIIRELATGSRGMKFEIHRVESALRILDKELGRGF